MAENVYDDPYDLASTDPLFLAAADAAHTGRWSVLDALWWEWHPEEPAPSGSVSPISRLRALQHRVFAADGDAAGDHAVAQVVRELEAEIVAERAAITDAIAAAHTDLARRRAGGLSLDPEVSDRDGDPAGTPGDTPGDGLTGETSIADVGADAAAATESAAARPARRRLLLALVLAAALIVAAILGGVLGNRLAVTGLGAAASPTPSATPDPPVNPAAVFAQAQLPKDIPAVAVSASFEPDSFRYLGSAGWPEDANLAGPSPFYAARTTDGLICLLAVPEGSGYLSTCAAESAYPATGLRLYWESTDYLAQMGPDFYVEEGAGDMIGDVSVIWGSTGEVSTQLTLRSPPEP